VGLLCHQNLLLELKQEALRMGECVEGRRLDEALKGWRAEIRPLESGQNKVVYQDPAGNLHLSKGEAAQALVRSINATAG
jgi:hypothetical protein